MAEGRTGPRGPEIADDGVALHRQVHPSWWTQDGRPSSQNFRPTPKDRGLLSLADGRSRSARAAFEFHTGTLGLRSLGTLTLPAAAWRSRGLSVHEDALRTADGDPHDDPAHAVADYRGVMDDDKKKRRISQDLQRVAGGFSYQPAAA